MAEAMRPSPSVRPRLIFSDGETLYPQTRRLVRERLGSDPIDVYGLVELSNFAWECEHRRGFHVSADSHIAEVEPGTGFLTVTDLGMTGMPIIRYRTGDHAEWGEACGCGRTLPVLAQIHGRVADAIRMPSGRRLYWPFFHELLTAVPGISEWRVHQHADASVTIRMTGDASSAPAAETLLRNRMPEPMALVCTHVAELKQESGAKKRVVTSECKG
jgi:phenylacetate-CoA ligase